MLLNKIRRLKSNVLNKASLSLLENVNLSLEKDKKIKSLEAKILCFEEQIKTQNILNTTIINNIEIYAKEKEKISKDIQLIVTAIKDIYVFIESSLDDEDLVLESLLKKNIKNNTYH